MRLLTDAEVLAAFWDPSPFLDEEGRPSAYWEAHILERFKLPAPLPLAWDTARKVSTIGCHRLVAPELQRIFAKLHSQPKVWATINDYGGCYAWRTNRNNPKKRSRHCWAIAIDLDVQDNPNKDETPEVAPEVIAAFAAEGWAWGGNKKLFPTPDPMHFEKGVA